MVLEIKDLRSGVDQKEILKGLSLTVNPGEIHTIMGPNGSGKSSLSLTLMGHPKYEVTDGSVQFDGKELLEMEAHERSLNGLFLSFQHPNEISGVTLTQFLLNAYNTHRKHADPDARQLSVFRFKKILLEECEQLKMNPEFLDRFLNKGFSGGEKKKSEILQMALLKPKLAILDEIDSGLDIDALKVVASLINRAKEENPDMALIIITHYHRILKYLKTDYVHVISQGNIIKSGDESFAHELEEKGYEWLIEKQ